MFQNQTPAAEKFFISEIWWAPKIHPLGKKKCMNYPLVLVWAAPGPSCSHSGTRERG